MNCKHRGPGWTTARWLAAAIVIAVTAMDITTYTNARPTDARTVLTNTSENMHENWSPSTRGSLHETIDHQNTTQHKNICPENDEGTKNPRGAETLTIVAGAAGTGRAGATKPTTTPGSKESR